jgi:hypothetical protein
MKKTPQALSSTWGVFCFVRVFWILNFKSNHRSQGMVH